MTRIKTKRVLAREPGSVHTVMRIEANMFSIETRTVILTAGNFLAVKREEKRLRAKLQLRQGEDDPGDDDEEEDTEEDEEGAGWGTKKRVYYDADGVSSLPIKEYCMPSLGTQGAQSTSVLASHESQCRYNNKEVYSFAWLQRISTIINKHTGFQARMAPSSMAQ